MVEIERLDAHERPPDVIRVRYKEYRNLKPAEIDSHPLIVDLQRLDSNGLPKGLCLDGYVSKQTLALAVNEFMNCDLQDEVEDVPIYSHQAVPGLRILPSILPHAVQTELLGRIFHRDLSNERHQTNIHLHYNIPYPAFQETPRDSSQTSGKRGSFFEEDPGREVVPKDPSIHKPLSIQSFLDRKLRWMTLGGQYNWTDKRYPKETPPPFPEDIAKLLHTIFPDTNAEAAIVNLYSPNDTLSVHRDVSEECDTGLISISFGCDGLFMVGHEDGAGCEVIRLRSGDAVYMTGSSRFAWHGVPRIIPSTCPGWLVDWPGSSPQFERWRGWISNKRINLNVRQMKQGC
ncbi:hypothetical protein FQN51_000937 [Onygenales sp. PD_10]|nr:hypothetical protein FQN51_000937 [Onygenales sp. PD_10]